MPLIRCAFPLRRVQRPARLPAWLAAGALAALPVVATAGLPSTHLLVADSDVDINPVTNEAGAILDVDLTAADVSLPATVTSALSGAPFENVQAVVVSPF